VLELLTNTFVMLIVVIDPVGLVPIFAAITQGESAAARRRMALRGISIAALILVTFVFIGDRMLEALGIGVPAFQIAGGALLFLLAVDMVLARHSGLRSPTQREQEEAVQKKDVSVFPLAFPLIAGPGALTTVLLMVGNRGDNPVVLAAELGVLALVLGLTMLALLFATPILRVLGETGANVVSRLLGVILAALAVQYMLDGLQAGLLWVEVPATVDGGREGAI
jgi:multiple antibiotic resistance protein